MKKVLLSALAAGLMSISASALALPTQNLFQASIVSSALPIQVGTLIFDLDQDLGTTGCQYYYEWDSNTVLPISADGFVVETKTHGHASCFANAMTGVTTVVMLPGFGGFGGAATGFDRFQQFRSVAQLILGEDSRGNMNGIIQYAGAGSPSTMVESLALLSIPSGGF